MQRPRWLSASVVTTAVSLTVLLVCFSLDSDMTSVRVDRYVCMGCQSGQYVRHDGSHWGHSGASSAAAPVLIHLYLGDTFRESMSVSPIDMEVGDNLILGWGWISSHDLRHLFVAGQVSLRSGQALLELHLLPAEARSASRTLVVIGTVSFGDSCATSRARTQIRRLSSVWCLQVRTLWLRLLPWRPRVAPGQWTRTMPSFLRWRWRIVRLLVLDADLVDPRNRRRQDVSPTEWKC